MTNSQYDLLMPNKTEVTPAPSMHAARANRPPALSAAYPDRNFPWSGKHRQRLAKQVHTTKQPPRVRWGTLHSQSPSSRQAGC